MNNEPNKPIPAQELTEKELEGVVGGCGVSGPNVRVQGAEDLSGSFEDMGVLNTEDGAAGIGLSGKQFFKVKAEALPVVK